MIGAYQNAQILKMMAGEPKTSGLGRPTQTETPSGQKATLTTNQCKG